MNATKLVLGTAVIALAGTSALGQIALSEHNFSSYGWSGGEICKPCHTPHFATMPFPLWNHALTNATYTMHSGTASASDTTAIDSRSRMCLGCHDGTVALDSFGGRTGTNFIGATGDLGTDLSNDHPIGREAVYPQTAEPDFNPIVVVGTTRYAGLGTNLLRLRNMTINGVTEYTVGCSTCHTVHNDGNYDHMVRFGNASSALCLSCHIK